MLPLFLQQNINNMNKGTHFIEQTETADAKVAALKTPVAPEGDSLTLDPSPEGEWRSEE
jgi:hypothetical protein